MGGGCAAKHCFNSGKKGYIMKVFPTCPIRRAEWAKNAGRENWIPTQKSCLCEVHFAPEMWEQRADRKPKLKRYAVPTIFGYYLTEKTFFKSDVLEDEIVLKKSWDHTYSKLDSKIKVTNKTKEVDSPFDVNFLILRKEEYDELLQLYKEVIEVEEIIKGLKNKAAIQERITLKRTFNKIINKEI